MKMNFFVLVKDCHFNTIASQHNSDQELPILRRVNQWITKIPPTIKDNLWTN